MSLFVLCVLAWVEDLIRWRPNFVETSPAFLMLGEWSSLTITCSPEL